MQASQRSILMTHIILDMTIMKFLLYLSIMKRNVKMQSHFSPPCGGKNSFGMFSKIRFHFHFFASLSSSFVELSICFTFTFLLLFLSFVELSICQQMHSALYILFSVLLYPYWFLFLIKSRSTSWILQRKDKGQPYLRFKDPLAVSQVLTSLRWPDSAGWWVISQKSRVEPNVS